MDAAIESIRKEQAQKLESNIQEGKRAKEMAKRTGGPSSGCLDPVPGRHPSWLDPSASGASQFRRH